MNSAYQFYDMMGFPAPFQREFFGYFDEENELVGGEPMSLSWALPSDSLKKTQDILVRWNGIWKYLPYVEMVYITGNNSFNTESDEIGFWIIASAKRMWSVYVMIKIIFFLLNIRFKKKNQPLWRIDALQEENNLSIQMLKTQEYDVIPMYQLAHLSLCYQKFETYARSLFEENKRINEYLPNFPLQTVIGCGIQKQMGKKSIASHSESLFANIFGDLINFISKQVVLFFFVSRKQIKGTNMRILEYLIWRDTWQKDQVMLTWKVLRKK